MILRNIRYKSDNLIIQELNKGHNGVVIIHGAGYSVSVDENNEVTYCDPLFIPPKRIKDYGNCTVLTIYFPKTCMGLNTAGYELTSFINKELWDYHNIILHGHSKCGCCFLHLAPYLTRKVTIISVSAPLKGTPVADLENFGSRLNSFQRFFYLKIFSDHKVDKDICPDSVFIKGLGLDLEYCVSLQQCYIITSKCGWSWHPVDWCLWLLDKIAGINGDGIVPEDCQIPDNLPYKTITASHATSLKKSIKAVEFLNSIVS